MEYTFQYYLCKKFFIEDDSFYSAECCVGGHWTPHSSDDRPNIDTYFVQCCHQDQKQVE